LAELEFFGIAQRFVISMGVNFYGGIVKINVLQEWDVALFGAVASGDNDDVKRACLYDTAQGEYTKN
jgi:hypothetical protein